MPKVSDKIDYEVELVAVIGTRGRQGVACRIVERWPTRLDVAKAHAITRQWQPDVVRTRYDWLFDYEARTLPLTPETAATYRASAPARSA